MPFVKFVAAALSLALLSGTASAQLAVGPGKIEASARSASGLANDGFSAFHLMLAGLDRKDLGEAMKQRIFAAGRFREATIFYREAEAAADKAPLGAASTEALALLRDNGARYGVGEPYSRESLIAVADKAVEALIAEMDRTNLADLLRDQRGEQALAERGLALETLLLNVSAALAQPGP